MKSISHFIIIGLLVFSGFFAWQEYLREYHSTDRVQVNLFPEEIAGWTSEDIPLTENDYAILETRNLFVRMYTSPDKTKQVMLYIIYSTNNRRVSHPPEMCFAGSGLSMVSNKPQEMAIPGSEKVLRFNRMHWEKKGVNQLVYHWYKAGDDFTESYWGQQIQVAMKSLFRQNASIAMIRLSTPFLEKTNLEQADKNLQEFAQMITPLIPQYVP